MPQVLGQNDDGTFTVQRDDGTTLRVARLPPSLAAPAPMGMDLPRISPGATAAAPPPMPAAAPAPAGPLPASQMTALADFATATKRDSAPPAPGAMPVPQAPSAVDALVDSVGMGAPKTRPGPPTEFAGFRGDPATMTRNAATGQWTPGGVNETPQEARADPIPVPASVETPAPKPLGRDAFISGGAQPGAAGTSSISTLVRGGPNVNTKAMEKALTGLQTATAERIAFDAQQAEVRAAQLETETRLAEERETRRLERQAQREAAAKAEEDKLRSVLSEAERPPPEVDPDRLWKSKSTGKKILGALMEGFHAFGAGLQGRQHESRLRSLIQDDIALQRDAIQRAGENQRLKAANQNLLLSAMRERFGDEIAAEKAAEAYAMTHAQERLQTMMAKTEDKAKLAAGQEELAKLEVYRQNALQDFKVRNMQLAMQMEERQARLAAAAAGPAPKAGPTVPATEAANIGELKAARKSLAELRKSFHDKTGMVSGVTQYLPGTSAALYADEAFAAAQTIGSILEGGKLTDADFPKYQRMLPQAGDSRERADAKVSLLARMLDEREKGKVEGLTAAGFSTGGFKEMQGPASLQRKY